MPDSEPPTMSGPPAPVAAAELAREMYDAGTDEVERLYPGMGGMTAVTWDDVVTSWPGSHAMWLAAARSALKRLGGLPAMPGPGEPAAAVTAEELTAALEEHGLMVMARLDEDDEDGTVLPPGDGARTLLAALRANREPPATEARDDDGFMSVASRPALLRELFGRTASGADVIAHDMGHGDEGPVLEADDGD